MVETIRKATGRWALTLFVGISLAFRSSEPWQDIGGSSFSFLTENGGRVRSEGWWSGLLLGAKTERELPGDQQKPGTGLSG